MNEKELTEALAVYKVRHGYTNNKSIDIEKLNSIIKEIHENKTTKRKSTRTSRQGNK